MNGGSLDRCEVFKVRYASTYGISVPLDMIVVTHYDMFSFHDTHCPAPKTALQMEIAMSPKALRRCPHLMRRGVEYRRRARRSLWSTMDHPRQRLVVLAAVLSILVAPLGWAGIDPLGAVQVPDGGYLYALDDGVFTDTFERLTIEMWIWLDSPLDDHVVWPLVGKELHYAINLEGIEVPRPEALGEPDYEMYVRWRFSAPEGGGGGFARRFRPDDRPWPFEDWVHVAVQIAGLGGAPMGKGYVGGELAGSGAAGGGDRCDGGDCPPLVIGGIATDVHWQWGLVLTQALDGDRLDLAPDAGWIDEVRITQGWRYGPAGDLDPIPVRGQGPDEDTLALWTFDDPPVNGRYEDVSGNGRALFLGGSLAVSPHRNLSATWAQFRRR